MFSPYEWSVFEWFIVVGAGALWHGWQIVWVGGLPRQLRSGETPKGEPGSQMAFQLFWLDQYAWIGISLSALALLGILIGIAQVGWD